MSAKKSNVVSLAAAAAAADTDGAFLDLLGNDMTRCPDRIVPLSSDLLARVDELCDRAEEIIRNEAMEC